MIHDGTAMAIAQVERDEFSFVLLELLCFEDVDIGDVLQGDFDLGFEFKNLTDDQTADFAGFPLPGRSFFGTVQYRFDGSAGEPVATP